MELRESREGDTLVIAPDGSLAGSEETSALEARLGAAIKAGFQLLVIDCTSVGQMTSSAIRVLLLVSRKLGRTGGRLVLFGMNAKVKKAFSISGFDKDFTVVATRDEALQRALDPVSAAPSRTAVAVPDTAPVQAEAPDPQPVRAEPPPEETPPPAAAAPAAVAAAHSAAPQAPDPRVALAAALLDALGVHDVPPAAARAEVVASSDLEALAAGILAALGGRAS
jgi:anti-sigma B factor antagonist